MGRNRQDTTKPIPFGKHKGTPWREVDRNYLRWVKDNVSNHLWVEFAKQALSDGDPEKIARRAKKAEKRQKRREQLIAASPVESVVYADRDHSMPAYTGPIDPNGLAPWEDDTLDREFAEVVK